MKRFKIFGKTITATILGLLVLAGLGIAGLLSYYGKVVGTATVSQSVRLDGKQCTETTNGGLACDLTETFDIVAGNTYYTEHLLENEASVDAKINVVKSGDVPQEFQSVKYSIQEGNPSNVDCETLEEEKYSDTINNFPLQGNSVDYTLCIKYVVKINAAPGNYSVTTQVTPA